MLTELHNRHYMWLQAIPHFLKYSRGKICAVERNFCISQIIAVSAKINTPRKVSDAKVNGKPPCGLGRPSALGTSCKYGRRDIVRSLSRKEKDEQSNSSTVSRKSHYVQMAILNSTCSKFSRAQKISRA